MKRISGALQAACLGYGEEHSQQGDQTPGENHQHSEKPEQLLA
jgi:hypothetical protein